MEITDINCMVGRLPTWTRFTEADELLRAMDTYRIARAVVYHADALWNAGRGNEQVRDIAAESDGRIQACYVLRPQLGGGEMPPGDRLLAQIRSERPAAVRLLPANDGYPLDRFFCGELLEVLSEARLPVMIDYDGQVGSKLPSLVADFPELPIVLVRVAFRQSAMILPLLAKTNSVYVDIGALADSGLIDEIVSRIGSGQLLLGSGMPQYMPAGSLGLVMYAQIGEDDRAAILWRNWQRLQEARQ
jgi:predicted TIM-barrel fold metal-dependent hydrolase